ncbi:MAG: hypothetical protein ACRDS0_07460 [Pseudonocardiaceae bacterium]
MAEGQTSAWTTYLASDDADGTAKSIANNGGTVLVEPMDVPGAGRMCIAGGGSVLGGPHDTPFGRMAFLSDLNGAVFAVVGAVPPS